MPRRAARRPPQVSTRRSRRGLAAAIVICAAAPVALVLSLWSNLTEPFWFNEQWRAYFISDSGNWWAALKTDNAPFPAGWYFLERASGAIFGSTELTLRLPTAVFLPVCGVLFLLLARRWMPLIPAVLVSLIGTFTGCLIGYAIQLSEYQIDAAAVVAILLLHEVAWEGDDPGWHSPRVLLAYAGITAACSSVRRPSSSPDPSSCSTWRARHGAGPSRSAWSPPSSQVCSFSCSSSCSSCRRTR